MQYYGQQPQVQTMQVVVPPGIGPGMKFNAQTPHGLVSVTVPHNIQVPANGSIKMTIQVPVRQQPNMMVQQPQMVMQQPQMVVQQPQMVVQQPQMIVPGPQLGAPPIQQATSPAPQPMVMQQAATPPPKSPAETPKPAQENPAKGSTGEVVYDQDISSIGEGCGWCCDRSATPLGEIVASGKMPPDLSAKTSLSPSAWELVLDKFKQHQSYVSCYPVPCCEFFCACTLGCCCACAPCLICQHMGRSSFEQKVTEEANEMLKKYDLQLSFYQVQGQGHHRTRVKFSWM